jgi:hypothetical protein
MNMNTQQLIRVLNECKSTCEYCANACLGESHVTNMIDCIRTDKVCATICGATATVLSVTNANYEGLLEYCISVCEDCAAECEKHSHEHCQLCARNCRACAEACGNYLKTG